MIETHTTALILAAGKGTRMKSRLPKVLHPVLGQPLIVHVARTALSAGCSQVAVVVGHGAEEVEAALTHWLPGAPIQFAFQDEQLGTGHAVLCAASLLQHTPQFLVLSGDVPGTSEATLRALTAAGAAPVSMVTCELTDPRGYGRVVRGLNGSVERVVEERDATPAQRALRETNAGIYLLQTAFALEALGTAGSNNAQGEIYLTAVVDTAASFGGVRTVTVPEGPEVWGINDRVDLARVQAAMQQRLAEDWMRAGVTFDSPGTVWLDAQVELASDVHIGRGVRLEGGCKVSAGARIDDGVQIRASVVREEAHIKPYCVLDESWVGPAAEVGPFAHLRPGTRLEARVKVGNFVETKKAHLGEGAKASHLSYLGDVTVGSRANVGAGTITCNYDGKNKLPTVIGEGAFIGSDTQLVAPVSVGAGAYVGAGTTVTQDVPPGALAVSRTPQRNIEGWVARRQAKQEK